MKSRIVALAATVSLSLGVGGVAVVQSSHAVAPRVSATQAAAYPTLTRGTQGNAVEVLQRLLNANGAKLGVDGKFGNATHAAVISFQRKKQLATDGSVGPQTWSKLLPVLKYGAKNSSVTALQQTLTDQGHRTTADGSFGPDTRNAVKAFQKAHGLAADGSVGPLTWRVLLGSAQGPHPKPPVTKPPTPKNPTKGTWVAMDQLQTGTGGKYSCGPTSVAMVLVGKGKSLPGYGGPDNYAKAVANLRNVSGTTPSGTGANGMERALEKYGVQDQRTKNTATALKAAREGKPVILNGYTRNLPWLGGNDGHYIVVRGYDAATGKYQVLDPWKGRSVETTAGVLTRFGNSTGDPRGGSWREHHIIN